MKLKSNPFPRSALLAAATLGMITSAQATPYYWDNTSPIETSGFGTAGGTWGTDAKWSTSITGVVTPGISAPTTTDDLFFGTNTATFGLAGGTVTVSGTVNAKSLTFGSQSGDITLSGGTAINLAATSTITVNNPSATISTTITGATTLNKAGSGTLILGHATNTLPDAVALNISAGKLDFGANSDTIGIVGMTGGQIGGGTSGTLTATRVNVSSTTAAEMTGGNILSGGTNRGLTVGSSDTATFTISGGTFTSNGSNVDTTPGSISFLGNTTGNGTLVIDGGAYVGNGMLKLGYFGSGSGTLTIKSGSATIKTLSYNAAASGGSAIVNLNGGTLTVSDIIISTGATKQFNFGGGTLTTATGVDLPASKFTGLTMTVNGGGAKIDTLDRTISINEALQAGTGSGGLTKSGSGTLALGGTNTYTGTTTIRAGTLKVNTSTTISTSSSIIVGDTGSSNAILDATTADLTVGSTQTLAGIGKVFATGKTLTSSGTISPGDSSVGNLTIDGGSLTLNSTSKFTYTLGTSSDLVTLLNGVALSGNSSLGFADFTFTAGLGFGNGVYTLIDNAGSIATLLDSSNLSGTIDGRTATLSTSTLSGNDLILTVVPEPNVAALLGGFGMLALLRRRR